MHHLVYGLCLSEDDSYIINGKEIDGYTIIHQIIPALITKHRFKLQLIRYGNTRFPSLSGICLTVKDFTPQNNNYISTIPENIHQQAKECSLNEYDSLLLELDLNRDQYRPKVMMLYNN